MQFSHQRQAVRFSLVLSLALFILLGAGLAPNTHRFTQALQAATTARAQLPEAYGKLPLSFEANVGQAAPSIKFLARGQNYGFFLTQRGATLQLQAEKEKTVRLQMKLIGAHPAPQLTGEAELPGKSHYLHGRDQSWWRRNITNYARVRYHAVYPGIDLVELC